MPYVKPQAITAERAEEILSRERNWYPEASDLALPDVPFDYREDVRTVLSFLGKVPITDNDGSWLIAMAVADLANNPRVQYVEGLMSKVDSNRVTPGAWNLADGHIFSLFTEVLNRSKFAVWAYEPLKIYPLATIYAARKAKYPTCSAYEYLSMVDKPDYSNLLDKVFHDPLQRMLARKSEHKVINLDWSHD